MRAEDNLALVIERMLESGLRELPVTDSDGHLLGYVDDQIIVQAYQRRAPALREPSAPAPDAPPPLPSTPERSNSGDAGG